jgi:hypothetical protein
LHGKLKRDSLKRGASIWENAILLLIGVSGFFLAASARSNGIQRKWVTALFGTLIPFCLVIFLRRRSLRWSFWVGLSICLGTHLVAIWVFFRYVLADFETFSPLFWLPVMLVEIFVLLVATKRIEQKLTGNNEAIKIGF